jgi:type II secretory pathway component GspD/PulD (secretin)
MSMSPRLRIAAVLAFAAGGACTTPESHEDRLLARSRSETWVEADPSTAEGRRVISDELARARGAVVSAPIESRPAPQEVRRTTSRPAPPPLPPWPGPKLAIVFDAAPLRDVVAAVAAEMKVNAIVPQDLEERVTVNFPSIDPLFGIDALLRRSGRRADLRQDVLTVVPLEKEFATQSFTVTSHRAFDPEKLVRPLLTVDGVLINDDARRRFTVTDVPDALDRVAAFMQGADRRDDQVLIEALLVEVRRGRDSAHGANIEALDIDLSGGYQGNVSSLLAAPPTTAGAPPFRFGVVNTDEMLQALFSARAGRTKFNVLSNPLVAAISGTEAEIKVTERIPYVQSTNSINVNGGNAATNSTEQIAFEEVGVTLTVLPEVGADGVIKMRVVPDVRELVDFALGVPVIDSRKVTSNVFVRNNETLVIGGLLRSSKRLREDKVPVLGDIPLLGDLFFKREVEDNERVELLILVTPHQTGVGSEPVHGFQAQQTLLAPGGRLPLVDEEMRDHPAVPTGVRR